LLGFNDKSGTRWKFSLIPAGGYVKIFGDSNEASTPNQELLSKLNQEEKSQTMHFKPIYQKALIVFGGTFANLLFAFVILWFFFAYFGKPFIDPVVTLVKEHSAAEKAGLKVGDRITHIDNNKIDWFDDIKRITAINTGTQIVIKYLREDLSFSTLLTPDMIKGKDFLGNEVLMPQLGIMSDRLTYKNLGIINSAYFSVVEMYNIINSTIKVVGQMIAGKRDASSLGGPIRIAKYSGQSLQKGTFTVFWFLAMISINLGVINLLPIPLLDGGHLFFYCIEALKGPEKALKYQAYASKVGVVFLAALFLFVTFNDIRYLFK